MPEAWESLATELSAPTPAPASEPWNDLYKELGAPPAAPPGGPTMQQTQEDGLRKLEGAPPIPVSPVIQAIKQATANPILSDKPLPWRNMATSILTEFQKAGLDVSTAFNDQYSDDARRASDEKYAKIIQGAGLDRFNGGEESRKDKATLRAGAFAWELLDRMPLPNNVAAPLVKETLGQLIDKRLRDIHDQIVATGPQGQGGSTGIEDYDKLAAAAQQLRASVNDGNAAQVYERAVLATVREPHNSWEAQVLRTPRGAVVEDHTPGDTFKSTSFSIGGWQPMALRPGESPVRKATLADIDALLAQVMGPDASKILYNEVGRAKTAYFGSKLSLIPTQDGAVIPGQIVDGQSFLTFVPGGAMERLMARGMGSQPEVRQTLRKVESEQGKEAAAIYAKNMTQMAIGSVLAPMADRLSQPPELNQMNTGLTPVEEASMGKGLNAAIGHGQQFLASIFEEGTQLTKDVDLALNRSAMFKAIVTRAMIGGAATSDAESINRLQTLGEALTYAYRKGTLGRALKVFGGSWNELPIMNLVDKDKEAARSERARALGFGPGSTLGKDLAMASDENAAAMVAEYFGTNKRGPNWSASKTAEDHAAFLGDVVSGKIPLTPGVLPQIGGAILYLGGYGMTAGTAQIFAGVADDPHTIGGLMAQGVAMGGVGKAVGLPISELSRSVIGAFRLKTQLSSIFRYHPEQIGRFLDAGRAQLDKATAAGRPSAALNDMVANLEVFTKNRSVEGLMKDSGEASRIVRTAWPELQDGLGDLAHGIGEGLLPKSMVAKIKETLGILTPPDKRLVALMGSTKDIEPTIGALADMTGARGDALILKNKIDNFVEDSGRGPTPDEMKTLWPQSFVDLHGLMVSAERGGLREPLMNRLWSGVTGKPSALAGAIINTADQMMNRYISATLDLVDRTYSWGRPRQRSAVILDVARSRLEGHTQTLGFEADLVRQHMLRAQPGAQGRIILEAQLRSLESNLFDTKRESSILGKANDELRQHTADKPWGFTPEVNQILFAPREAGHFFERGLVNGDTLGNILELHPVLFEGRTAGSLWKQVRRPLSEARNTELQITSDVLYGRMRQARKDVSAARRTRVSGDEQLLAWQARKNSLEQIANKDLVKGARMPEIEDLQAKIDKRTQLLKDETIDPAHLQQAESELKLAIRDHKEHQQLAARLRTEGNLERTLDPQAFQDIIRMTEHDGLGDLAKGYLDEAQNKLSQARVQDATRVFGNPFDADFAPATKKGQFVHDFVHSYAARNQAHVMKVEELVQEYSRFSQKDKDTLSEIQRNGGWVPDRFRSYVSRERQTFKEFWDLMRVTGRTPEHVMKTFERFNLDPLISGAKARPGLVRSDVPRRAAQLPESTGGNPIISALGGDWSEMMFRRDAENFRVHVQEETKVVDKTFKDQAAVNEWMDQTYGRDAWKRIEKETNGKRRGQTIYGEPITVGNPMSDLEAEVMDFAKGATGEARLDVLRRGLLDAQSHILVNALNGFGDMVMDQAKFDRELRGKEIAAQYRPIPDNPQVFGVLAGKHVHIDALREVNAGARLFKNVEALVSGWKEAVEAISPPKNPKEAIFQLPNQSSKLWRGINEFTKSNVILKSMKTWMVNWTFNMISDHLAGTNVMSVEGMGEYFRNMRRGQPSAWEPYITEGRAQGILGGFWEEDSAVFNDTRLRIFGIEPKDKAGVEALAGRRRALFDRLRFGEGTADQLATVELDMFSVDKALEEANRGWAKKLMRWVGDTMISSKTILGQPKNRAWGGVRRLYNHIDENFKMGQYVELRQRGLTPEGAASIVRMFSQDYANIPGWVRGQGGPFRSLVTSFPYEASRIISNAALYKPMRFMSLVGAVPFINLLSFSSAGMNWDRSMAMLSARGKKGQISAITGLMSTLYLTDPTKGEISGEIQVSNVMPFANLAQTRGLLPRLYDKMIPPERRGFLTNLAGLGIGFASNFVGNNPMLNFIGTTAAGVDSMTGEQLTDKDMALGDKIGVAMNLLAQDVLPPAGFYWGRDSVAWERSTEAPISTKTGRLFKADEAITVYIRKLFGITTRGSPAEDLGGLAGLPVRSRAPLVSENDMIMSTTYQVLNQMPGVKPADTQLARYGEYNEQRRLIQRSVDNTLSADERKKAETASEAMFKTMHQAEIDSLPVEGGTTDRQYRLMKQRIINDGPADWFALQPVHVQAATLALLDKQQLSDQKMRELVTAMELSPMGKMKNPSDEGLIGIGIKALSERISEPGHNPRLEPLRAWLKVKAVQAGFHDKIDSAIEPIRQGIKTAIRGAR